jgi:hypothetical protein
MKLLLSLLLVPSMLAASGLFPKMQPSPKSVVVDGRRDELNARLSLQALQGLINQEQAEVYLLTADHHLEQLALGARAQESLSLPEGRWPGLRALLGHYRGRVKKFCVYDPQQDWTFYLALMAGAQNQGIPVTEEIKNGLIDELGLEVAVDDFRGRWDNRIEAYQWAITHLMPNAGKQVVLVGNYHMRMFDYAVASKSFIFWLDFTDDAEIAQVRRILDAGGYGAGVSLMGYANTADDANIVVNKAGVGYITSDFYANGSYWSSFPNKTYSQAKGKAIEAENGKVYVCLLWSDGDNLQFDQNMLYKAWKDPARGSIPVATALSPSLQELNTPLMDFFYDNKTPNDELICGPCGFQFIYTIHYDKAQYPTWLRLNRKWVGDAGFHVGSLWWTRYPSPAYEAYTASTGLTGLFHNFNNIGNAPILSNGVGLFREYITECRDSECVYRDLAAVSNPDAPEFRAQKVIQPEFLPNGYAVLKEVADRLERDFPGKYVFMRPSDFVATAKLHAGRAKAPEAGREIRRISFAADNSHPELGFMHDNRSNGIHADHRFADLEGTWTYKFDLVDDAKSATVMLDIGGHFMVSAAPDNQAWVTLLAADSNAPRSMRQVDLSGLLDDDQDNIIYLRFSDGSPNDGHGPSLWSLSLRSNPDR